MNKKRVTRVVGGAAAALLLMLAAASERLYAAAATALVDVQVVLTISIANLTGLSFGAVSSGATPGSVIVQPDGTVISSGGVTLGDMTGAGAATFQLNGQPDAAFTIQLPPALSLTSSAGDTLTVSAIQSQPSVTGQLDASGALVLRVGGTLEVGALQPAGDYSGLMSVSVNYN